MASTHTWHPGSRALEPAWPVPTDLLPDEILSSWLVRSALRQGCAPPALTGHLWPGWRPWVIDIDRTLPSARLDSLSRASGITSSAIRSATLAPITFRVEDFPPRKRAIWPWVLALGARNTKRRSGLQYCPQCLAEDEEPYFRIQWRFAWHTGCAKHGCSLRDRCCQCDSPLEPHRIDAQTTDVTHCPTCGERLSSAPRQSCRPAALAFQLTADHALLEGQRVQQGQLLSVTAWFEVVGFFISLVRRSGRSRTEGQLVLLDLMGVEAPSRNPAGLGLATELLPVRDRQEIFGIAWPFLEAKKDRLIDAVLESGITQQGLADKDQQIPASIHELFDRAADASRGPRRSNPARRGGPRPRHEVKRMMTRLERKLEMKRR